MQPLLMAILNKIVMVKILCVFFCGQTFLEADTNRDGNIDIDEWRVYVNRNPGVIRIMTIPYLRYMQCCFYEIHIFYV